MMRRASSLASRSVPLVAKSNVVTLGAPIRLFGSHYSDDIGNYKRPYAQESRSGAHRHPPRKQMLREQRAAAAVSASPSIRNVEVPKSGEEDEAEAQDVPARRSNKNRYEGLFKKAKEPISFTSNFREPDMKPILDSTRGEMHRANTNKPAPPRTALSVDDTDVTRIYSDEEVRTMQYNERSGTNAGSANPATISNEDDVKDSLSTNAARPGTHAEPEDMPKTKAAPDAVDRDEDEDEFAEIRSHPFFMDMLRRVERNMIRFRKETRAVGRYSLEAVDECVRPLLQLTDYPLTARQLSHLSHSISPAVLKSSLRDQAACRRLKLYRSQDTDLLLDWSAEDFLRRRYESVHMSWEPMDVICRRFGWTPEMMSNRDYLLYFSAFPEYVEMAELQTSATGGPKAIPIEDPEVRAAQNPIPPNRLLLRRKASVSAEASLTESIRLMGTPAITTPSKSKKAQRMRQHGGDSVSDYFDAVKASAAAVDGDEAVKLQHAVDNVQPLRQASHPGGRTIREFSIPKSHLSTDAAAPAELEKSGMKPPRMSRPEGEEALTFDQRKFEELSNAYHNVKVENSLIRRRMLATDSVDKAQEMQHQLASGRREQSRLEQELERMRELKRNMATTKGGPAFALPREQPQYMEAPEHTGEFSKNGNAVEDIDDDEIEQALKKYKEQDELRMMGRPSMARDVNAAPSSFNYRSASAADAEDDLEVVEEVVEVDDDDDGGNLEASEDKAMEEESSADAQERPVISRYEETDSVGAHENATSSSSTKAVSRPWQDELEAAVEQQEAEVEERENDFDAAINDTSDTTPASRLQQLTLLHDRLSSAAERARRYVATVETRRQQVVDKLDSQLMDANAKVERLEGQLSTVEEEQSSLRDSIAQEEAERKALAVEAELKAQREKRLVELERERERARIAQEEAAKALERQKRAEREALAMEEELQRKLRDVQSKLRSLHGGELEATEFAAVGDAHTVRDRAQEKPKEPTPASAAAPSAEQEIAARNNAACTVDSERQITAEGEDEEVSSSNVQAGQFMCTPEQYDGLFLAAHRLKKEIAALEAQMEEEGDENDETLMAVLAASRADLEELEECIGSVQASAPWAASRDAKREREEALSAVADTEAHRLQSDIDNYRFQISLLEKRLHHASQKSVTAKLRERVVQCRKSISRLRMEQDHLRRSGRDSMGLPPSISIAETLAHESNDEDGARMAEEVRKAAAEDHSAAPFISNQAQRDAKSALEYEAAEMEDDAREASSRSDVKMNSATNPDAEKLRARLDGMVKDIQQLQNNIEAQERTSDYDGDGTEVVLREMKDKLSQLLRLRDQVQRALLEESVNDSSSSSSNGATPIIRPSSTSSAATPVMSQAVTSVHGTPSSSRNGRTARVTTASKKIHASARSASFNRRR